jgi:hypothetical protein
MLADYDFYKNTYKGIVITDANSYDYFGERASDELALYSSRSVFNEDATAKEQLKKCACRIADILYSSTNGGKSIGKSVASESVAGYYSVSYAQSTEDQLKAQINTAVKLYIGKYIIGAKMVLW